ncbi:MAG: acetate--CoA ligase [Candidatus Aenigmarchaeota archaeon ex4484_56]|nr:MAG: acetate--CoA ligase [Candidatus Aenigmarchaeota archaeon ex4484_56]
MKLINKKNLYYPPNNFKKRAWIHHKSIYKDAKKNPVKYWEEIANELIWFKKWNKPFIHKPPYFHWFVGGKINITYNALDRNLKERKNKIALIWEPEPKTENRRVFTYYELYREVNKFANALKKLGVKKGDVVGIYMPMIPEAIIAMLACARIGAIHTVVFSAFSPDALRIRLQETNSKVLITADGYYRKDKIINLKKNADEGIKETNIKKVIVVKRANNKIKFTKNRDYLWDEVIKNQKDYCEPQKMDAEDILFILFTSGSTGKPKGILHSCGGYTVQAYWTAKIIFDLWDDDIFWSTADIGWITGHTYSCYGPLLNGVTYLIYEGALDYPERNRWCEIIEKYGITTFYTAPTAVRIFEKELGKVKEKLETLQIIASVGEPIDEKAWKWFFSEVGKKRCPILDTWWQTETGGILITSLPGIGPFKPTFAGLPFPGVIIDILNSEGHSVKPYEEGNLVILPPFTPGMLRGVYKNPKKYKDTYFSEYGDKIYFTSDIAYKDKNGLIRIVGRADDIIKVAGHRISTGELENIINKNKKVSECAVIGVPHEIKGQTPVVFVVSASKKITEKEIIETIDKGIGKIARPGKIYFVSDLPKTRSGKIMRRILRRLLTNENLGDLSTLANPQSVEEIKKVIKK